MKIKSNKGFTLIEALIVVIIVGLLAAVGIVKLGTAKTDTLNSLSRTAATDINKGIQRAIVAENGNGWTTATAALTGAVSNADAKVVVTSLVAAGHLTKASGDEMTRLLNNTATPVVRVSGGAAHGASTLLQLGLDEVEFVSDAP